MNHMADETFVDDAIESADFFVEIGNVMNWIFCSGCNIVIEGNN